MIEATYDCKKVAPYYKYKGKPTGHFPFNFTLTGGIRQKSIDDKREEVRPRGEYQDLSETEIENRSFTPKNIKRLIEEWRSNIKKENWSNWGVSVFALVRIE
jgi:hypothetical protein